MFLCSVFLSGSMLVGSIDRLSGSLEMTDGEKVKGERMDKGDERILENLQERGFCLRQSQGTLGPSRYPSEEGFLCSLLLSL